MKDTPLNMRFVMAFGLTLAYVSMIFKGIDTPDAMVALVTAGWSWFFGSSSGSERKDKAILKDEDNDA